MHKHNRALAPEQMQVWKSFSAIIPFLANLTIFQLYFPLGLKRSVIDFSQNEGCVKV